MAHGLVEINTRLRSDPALQQAFGRQACAQQSVVQQTLDACTAANVAQMQAALTTIFRQHSRAYQHNYRRAWQLLDVDITGLPCGKRAELSRKGYFSTKGIRYGRQLGRVVAMPYQEIVVDQLLSGDVQLSRALRPLALAAEAVLKLDECKRRRTIIRVDAGGGSIGDVNWLLERGYQIHGKDCPAARATAWAATVVQWHQDPRHPDRQMGWAEPATTPDYVRPVRRLVIRLQKNNGQRGYAMLISTLAPADVLTLTGLSLAKLDNPQAVASAYAEFYDRRGGSIEIEIKEDKQGFGLSKRQKKRAVAQQMVVLLNELAHNVLVWARAWLSEAAPRLKRYGMLRLVRDVLGISGKIELQSKTHQLKRIILNRAAPLLPGLLTAQRDLICSQHIVIILDET